MNDIKINSLLNIAAVVVTFNRKELLIECINSLLNQSYPLKEIYIIDNASTDGTYDYLLDNKLMNCSLNIEINGILINYNRLEVNIGGAGGFYEGIKLANEAGHQWIWILDDDTIANPDSLEQFNDAFQNLPDNKKPSILASKVCWEDGTIHPMNQPLIKTNNYTNLFLSIESKCISIRTTSFVSLLLSREMIDVYGYPNKEYFIWNDYFVYSARILKKEFGVLVPKSIVVHKTKQKYTPLESSGDRYYFEVRNKIWVIKTSSFSSTEKIKIVISTIKNILKYIKINNFRPKSIKTILKGLFDGLFRHNHFVRGYK